MEIAVVTVQLALNVENEGEAADAVSAILSEQLRCYNPGSNSALLNWWYLREKISLRWREVPDDYGEDSDAGNPVAIDYNAVINAGIERLQALTGGDFHGYRSEIWGLLADMLNIGAGRRDSL